MYSTAFPTYFRTGIAKSYARQNLSWVEQSLLAIGICEIPLGIDSFLMYSVEDADLGAVGGLNISVATFCIAMLYLLWFFGAIQGEVPAAKTILGIPQILYLSTVALSIFAAERRLLALSDLFLLLQSFAIFYYIANRIRSVRDLYFSVSCLAAALLTQGSIMIAQRAMGTSIYGERIYLGPVSLSVWEDGRTAGTLVSAVLAGSWMAILWVVVLSLFLVVRDQRLWWFLGGSLFIGILGTLFTQTRGALISVAFGSLVVCVSMFVRGWLPRWTIAIGVIGLLVAFVPIVQVLQNRVVGDDDGSAESRTHLSAIAFETIAKNPLFGHGAGNCHLACLETANRAVYRSEWYYTVHCKYLLVWIETGIIGLSAFVIVLINALRYGLVAWFQAKRNVSPIGLGCAAAMSGHMVHMFVDIFNSRPQVQTLWCIMGISAAAYRLALAPAPTRKMQRVVG